MFDKAVVCTDLTPDSDMLVGCAGGLRVLGVREAVLTHVVDIFRDPGGILLTSPEAEVTFERQLAMLEDSGYSVHVEAPMGLPAFSLEEVRRRHAATLIVVGSHGQGVFGEPFSGSTSSDLMQLSQTPVFVASLGGGGNGADLAKACGRVLGKVLYCTDFSEAADSAFTHVEALARLGAREFVLIHVRDTSHVQGGSAGSAVADAGGGADATAVADATAAADTASPHALDDTPCDSERRQTVRLAHMREALSQAGARHVEIRVVYGSPAEELAQRATSGEFTLIVMGSRGRRSDAEELLGGVSDRVVREARTPLLLVPSGASRQAAAG